MSRFWFEVEQGESIRIKRELCSDLLCPYRNRIPGTTIPCCWLGGRFEAFAVDCKGTCLAAEVQIVGDRCKTFKC